jgi:hypothetical protein
MTMSPAIRKFALTVHITSSVGWIGAVIAFLAIVIAAMSSQDTQTLRAAWYAMGLVGSFVIVPLAVASLFSGILMSLGTKWGLFQHYWVLISLILTLFATLILLGNIQTVNAFATIAAKMDDADVIMLRAGLEGELLHAGIGLVVVVVIQAMNVYKPRGLTAFGWRNQQKQTRLPQA